MLCQILLLHNILFISQNAFTEYNTPMVDGWNYYNN